MRPPRAFFPFFFFEGEGVCRVVQEGGEGGPEGGRGWSGTPPSSLRIGAKCRKKIFWYFLSLKIANLAGFGRMAKNFFKKNLEFSHASLQKGVALLHPDWIHWLWVLVRVWVGRTTM